MNCATQDGNNIEAMVMYGLTDKQPGALTALNRSWNFAPEVTDTNGCVSLGYEKRERAFKFAKTGRARRLHASRQPRSNRWKIQRSSSPTGAARTATCR